MTPRRDNPPERWVRSPEAFAVICGQREHFVREANRSRLTGRNIQWSVMGGVVVAITDGVVIPSGHAGVVSLTPGSRGEIFFRVRLACPKNLDAQREVFDFQN